MISKVEERLWEKRGMVSQEAKKENPNSWKWAGPICLDLQREEPFTLISCWSGFWAYKAMVQTLAPEPWWILKGKCCFMSLLEAHQHLLSLPPHTFTYTFTVPFLCIILGGASFWSCNSLYLFSFGGSCFPCKRKFFFRLPSLCILWKNVKISMILFSSSLPLPPLTEI